MTMQQILITEAIRNELLRNGARGAELAAGGDDSAHDPRPVLKLFVPWGAATWLITEMMPSDPDLLFGLCDLGMQCPELGYVRVSEIESITGPGGLRIERDMHWTGKHPLSVYADAARERGRIQEYPQLKTA